MTHNILNTICSGLTTTTDRKSLKKLLEDTEGWTIAQGYACDIRSKHLGVGVYKVWLEKRN
jgi:hypothetical protein